VTPSESWGGFRVHGTKGFGSDGQGTSNNNGNDNHE
jgi:hypothetical protein